MNKSQNHSDDKIGIKVLLIGDHNTGKTRLVKCFYELQDSEILTSLSSNSYSREILFRNEKLLLNTVDTNFTPDSIGFNSELVKDCNVIILTYSINSVDSFKNVLLKWKPALDEQNFLCPIVLAGLLIQNDFNRDRILHESAELTYNLFEHFQKGTKLDLRPNTQLIDFDKFDLKKLSESEFNSIVEKKQGFVQLNDAMRMCKNFGNKTFNTIETSSYLNLGIKEMFEMAIRSALRV